MSGIAVPSPVTGEQVADLAKAMPQPADVLPMAERSGAAIGSKTKRYALEDHQHPRLTSVTGATQSTPASHTILPSGLSPPVAFTQKFAVEPGLSVTPIKPAAADILLPYYVADWVMDGQLYAGVVIGWRKLVLNTVSVTVAGISVLGSSSVQQVAAAGTRFTCVAVARSDTPDPVPTT